MNVIVQNGDPALRALAAPISDEEFGTPELAAMVKGLAEALDAERDGVAIAAPQVGISKRIFVVRYDRLHVPPEGIVLEPDLGVYINPEFVRASRKRDIMDEGCLSVRGIYGKTYRHERATMRARDVAGNWFERGGGGILAQVFQHETDHLDGVLFIDHAIETYEPERAHTEETPAHE